MMPSPPPSPPNPNPTPGTLTINGNYQQGPGGTLDTEVAGPQASQTDKLNVTGTAAVWIRVGADCMQVISITGSTF